MSKMSTDLIRHAVSGPVMGTRWSAVMRVARDCPVAPVEAAMQAAVAEVDTQMSTWKPDSDLMRLNAAPPGVWVAVPPHLMAVLQAALAIGRASEGAFDIAVADAVAAWGFGPAQADPDAIRQAFAAPRRPAHDLLDLDAAGGLVRKDHPARFDLSGIAKGYGVDRLADVAAQFGIADALFALDGEVRAIGTRPDGSPWSVAVERPDFALRAPHAVLALQDAAVATSGDYRHWVTVGDRRFSHTMDPKRGGPLTAPPASVTVVAGTCMVADAWATALMVKGSLEGAALARRHNLDVLFLDRDGDRLRETCVGGLFQSHPVADLPDMGKDLQ